MVSHPSEYRGSGYNEIQNPPKCYSIINKKILLEYFSIQNENNFREEHDNWTTAELQNDTLIRNQDLSESIAVGRKSFIASIQQQLASRAQKRSIVSVNGVTVWEEPQIRYSTVLGAEKDVLRPESTCSWR